MLLVFCLHETRVVRPRHVLATEQTYRQRRVVGLVSRIPQGKADETHAASAVDGMRVSPHFVQQPMQPACSFAAKLPDQLIGQRAIVCSQGGRSPATACLPSILPIRITCIRYSSTLKAQPNTTSNLVHLPFNIAAPFPPHHSLTHTHTKTKRARETACVVGAATDTNIAHIREKSPHRSCLRLPRE